MTHLLIIGGSDAGISAALRARELDSKVDVTVVVADSFPNYSICGIPFYLSGEVPDWRNLAHRTAEEITQTGINLLLNHTAQIMDTWDHKVYYPGANKLRISVTGDAQNGRLLGAQMVGHYQAEVAKRIDIFATALFHGMKVDELNELDLSYTPPLSSPWDPVQMSAQAWVKTAS